MIGGYRKAKSSFALGCSRNGLDKPKDKDSLVPCQLSSIHKKVPRAVAPMVALEQLKDVLILIENFELFCILSP